MHECAVSTQVMCSVWCSVWDVRSRQIVKTLETTDVVLSLEIVNSNLFVTADGKSVKLWDANSFQVVKSFSFPHKVESASYSPEKHKLAAGGEDMWVHLYDFDSGEEVDCNKGEILLHASMPTCLMLADTDLPKAIANYAGDAGPLGHNFMCIMSSMKGSRGHCQQCVCCSSQ